MRKTKTTKVSAVLPTENEAWGFWGTMRGRDQDGAWAEAFQAAVASGLKPEQARNFLDSRQGRHFADAWIDSREAAIVQVATFTGWWAKESGTRIRSKA